jgi:hypothetical protein
MTNDCSRCGMNSGEIYCGDEILCRVCVQAVMYQHLTWRLQEIYETCLALQSYNQALEVELELIKGVNKILTQKPEPIKPGKRLTKKAVRSIPVDFLNPNQQKFLKEVLGGKKT